MRLPLRRRGLSTQGRRWYRKLPQVGGLLLRPYVGPVRGQRWQRSRRQRRLPLAQRRLPRVGGLLRPDVAPLRGKQRQRSRMQRRLPRAHPHCCVGPDEEK